MAPLVYLVQALRYFGASVKAFIGIESIDLLRYQESVHPARRVADNLNQDFAATTRDAHIYVDDLKEAGVDASDIFVTSDKPGNIGSLIPERNYALGFVSKRYERYLTEHQRRTCVVAFACGPTRMMKAVSEVATASGIRLYVLMEKRMACGIGVCLSCVCETTEGYKRVCKDGPMFDASTVRW
jgi:NAD(P)H-flavin reductase